MLIKTTTGRENMIIFSVRLGGLITIKLGSENRTLIANQYRKLWSKLKKKNFSFKTSMHSDTLLAITSLLLPEILVSYFDLTRHEFKGEEIHFYFTELNTIPKEFKDVKLHSNFFLKLSLRISP